MATADHPDVPFVESRMVTGGPAYTRGRPDGPPIWVVVHDMEFPERTDAAEWTAAYFARGADGRSVSSHYTADLDSIVQCVRLADTAWTVGNRAGNYRGINWELAGFASQTREQWLDEFGRAMLTRIAAVMRRDMDRYGIPVRVLTDAQVNAFTPGVTSHAQLGRVFGGSDHTDPGRAFPWDVLLDLIEGETMPLTDADVARVKAAVLGDGGIQALLYRVEALVSQRDPIPGVGGEVNQLAARLAGLEAKLDVVLNKPTAGGGGVSDAQVRAAIGAALEAAAAAVRTTS